MFENTFRMKNRDRLQESAREGNRRQYQLRSGNEHASQKPEHLRADLRDHGPKGLRGYNEPSIWGGDSEYQYQEQITL